MMNRIQLSEYLTSSYGAQEEFLWESYPDCSVFRHASNKKWFAVLMEVPKSKLGLTAEGTLEIVNVKCDPRLTEALLDTFKPGTGLYPAYHMNKKHWLSVALDGSVSDARIRSLLDASHALTAPKLKPLRRGR